VSLVIGSIFNVVTAALRFPAKSILTSVANVGRLVLSSVARRIVLEIITCDR